MKTVLSHPLIDHRMALLRRRDTPPKLFRELAGEITEFLAYEALRDVRTKPVPVQTPVAETAGRVVDEPRLTVVPILRAGVGMLDAMLRVLPSARVGFLGMSRNEETAEPVAYCAKVPPAQEGDELALVVDPMLATGGSACDAVSQLKRLGYRRIRLLCLVAAPEGVARMERVHPDVPVFAAALDERLNSRFYIVPGLGDAGDRIFGTLPPCDFAGLSGV